MIRLCPSKCSISSVAEGRKAALPLVRFATARSRTPEARGWEHKLMSWSSNAAWDGGRGEEEHTSLRESLNATWPFPCVMDALRAGCVHEHSFNQTLNSWGTFFFKKFFSKMYFYTYVPCWQTNACFSAVRWRAQCHQVLRCTQKQSAVWMWII